MNSVVAKSGEYNEYIDKKTIEHSFQQLADQARRIEQKLTMKIESNITDRFHDYQILIAKAEETLDKKFISDDFNI